MVTADIERIAALAVRAADEPYRSPFTRWDDKASVRAGARRILSDEPAEYYFPPELVPVLRHPHVTGLGPDAPHRLLVQRLYQYLTFTSELEAVAVVPVTLRIARRRTGLALPAAMVADAYAITTDEAWHAQFSDDLLRQVESRTGIACDVPETPEFVAGLQSVRRRLGPQFGALTGIAFAVVSETLISALLAGLPKDTRLPHAVRQLIQDHALDEGRHHAYFRTLLKYFWPALGLEQRRALGPLLPELITVFLAPDLTATARALRGLGLTARQASEAIVETHDEAGIRGDIAAAAATTVRYLAETGVLDQRETSDAFEAAGLWPPAGTGGEGGS